MLENLSFQNDERIAALELSLQEAQMIAEDSDRKYDEVKNKCTHPAYKVSFWHLASHVHLKTVCPAGILCPTQ